MHSTVFIFFTAALLLCEVNGHLFQRAIPHMQSKNKEFMEHYKRQTDDVDQCIEDKVNAAFQGSTSDIASACKRFISDEETNTTTLDGFRTYCDPECGNVFLDAADECNLFEGGSGLRDFYVGLCGTNDNGEKCYGILFSDDEGFIDDTANITNCIINFLNSGECNCQSELSKLEKEYGCCLNLLYDLNAAGLIRPEELHKACNVNYPSRCNNSPLLGRGDFMPDDVDHCLEDKVDTAFEGSTSDIASACKRFISDEETNPLDGVRTYCNPECGNVFLDAADECNLFEGSSDFRDVFVGLCGTNGDGEKCYEIVFRDGDTDISNNVDFVNITKCITTFIDSNECNCQSELSKLEKEYGCCLNLLYDIIAASANGTFNKPEELHNACDVNYPSRCNNSPLSGSDGFMPKVALATLIFALIFSVVLG